MSDDNMMLASVMITDGDERVFTLVGDDGSTTSRALTKKNRMTIIRMLLTDELNEMERFTGGEDICEDFDLFLREGTLSIRFDEMLGAIAILSSEVRE